MQNERTYKWRVNGQGDVNTSLKEELLGERIYSYGRNGLDFIAKQT